MPLSANKLAIPLEANKSIVHIILAKYKGYCMTARGILVMISHERREAKMKFLFPNGQIMLCSL